jgi:hypothetical protein
VKNLLLEGVEYQRRRTRFGTWRRFMYPNGQAFAEFRSHLDLLGLPLLHYTAGICPETGHRMVAKGVIAVGRLAVGGLAIGQAAAGIIGVGQASLGLLFGLGQATAGFQALGQLGLGWDIGVGQLATGDVAVGQLAIGHWVLAQFGLGEHVWDVRAADPQAVEYFQELWQRVTQWFAPA